MRNMASFIMNILSSFPFSECYILQLDANAHKSYPQTTNLTVRLSFTPLVFPSHNNLNRPIQSYLGLLIRTLILMPLSMSHFQFPSKIKNHLTIKSCEVMIFTKSEEKCNRKQLIGMKKRSAKLKRQVINE